MLEHIPIALLKAIFPITETPHHRTQSMEVLCLGLGRTGTDSLRAALHEVGFKNVHHGFYLAEHPEDSLHWYRLALAKYVHKDMSFLNTTEFDKVLGDCTAVTDLPSATFAIELLRAYPEAKVVLNRRDDLDAWYQSQLQTIDRMYKPWGEWTRLWFDSETFWISRAASVSSSSSKPN